MSLVRLDGCMLQFMMRCKLANGKWLRWHTYQLGDGRCTGNLEHEDFCSTRLDLACGHMSLSLTHHANILASGTWPQYDKKDPTLHIPYTVFCINVQHMLLSRVHALHVAIAAPLDACWDYWCVLVWDQRCCFFQSSIS